MAFYIITTGIDCVGTEQTEIVEARSAVEAEEIAWELAGQRLQVAVDSRQFDTEDEAEGCLECGDFESLAFLIAG